MLLSLCFSGHAGYNPAAPLAGSISGIKLTSQCRDMGGTTENLSRFAMLGVVGKDLRRLLLLLFFTFYCRVPV